MTAQPDQTAPALFGELLTRHQITVGLRALAVFLDANPDIPVDDYGWTLQFHQGISQDPGTDHAQRAEVDRVAALLGVTPKTSIGGHYTASRTFGHITYEVTHIPARRMAEHAARMSYQTNITLDPAEDQGTDEKAA